jgi:hypothetical protein
VDQPFASFDGKHKEIGKEFYTRVSNVFVTRDEPSQHGIMSILF